MPVTKKVCSSKTLQRLINACSTFCDFIQERLFLLHGNHEATAEFYNDVYKKFPVVNALSDQPKNKFWGDCDLKYLEEVFESSAQKIANILVTNLGGDRSASLMQDYIMFQITRYATRCLRADPNLQYTYSDGTSEPDSEDDAFPPLFRRDSTPTLEVGQAPPTKSHTNPPALYSGPLGEMHLFFYYRSVYKKLENKNYDHKTSSGEEDNKGGEEDNKGDLCSLLKKCSLKP
jgi:hypothetical protein